MLMGAVTSRSCFQRSLRRCARCARINRASCRKGFWEVVWPSIPNFLEKNFQEFSDGLWPALNRGDRLPTVAILADVGNDLAYEAPVEKIIEWVERALDRLANARRQSCAQQRADRVAAARRLGPLSRAARGPLSNCKISHSEMLRRARNAQRASRRGRRIARNPGVFRGKRVVPT